MGAVPGHTRIAVLFASINQESEGDIGYFPDISLT